MIDAFRKYSAAGFACLPIRRDKKPALPGSWNDGFTENYFTTAEGIGVICGKRSGGLECLDFDNHFGDASDILTSYMTIPEVFRIYKQHRIPIEVTQNKGYHLLFRCDVNEGNKKLASRLNADGRPEAIIETRGEGGYFAAYPTPGYTVFRHDIFSIPVISEVERAILIDHAIAMNEFQGVIRNEYESGDRPGDVYNRTSGAIAEMKSILTGAGWTELENGRWRRPGKKEGISATLGKVADNVFYVFSSNAYPFDNNRAYTPFQVLALVKYHGDFKAAAEGLPKPEKIVTEVKVSLPESQLEKILQGARINLKIEIQKPPVILYFNEVENGYNMFEKRVFTLGNFSCVIGRAKSKKTFFLTMVTAAMIGGSFGEIPRGSVNISKMTGALPKEKNLVAYFDTEQGEYDSYNTIRRVERMAGTTDNLLAFNLRPFSPHERCQIIDYAFQKYGGRIGFCVIDGVADLSNGINDEDEATRVSTMLLRLTKMYNCHISTVIHQNKNDNWATGHLGSAVTKKAEIIISVVKDSKDRANSEVNCDMSRGPEFDPFIFTVNDDGLPEITAIGKKINGKATYYDDQFETPQAPF